LRYRLKNRDPCGYRSNLFGRGEATLLEVAFEATKRALDPDVPTVYSLPYELRIPIADDERRSFARLCHGP
jgi:hypothetical protein